MFILDEGYVCNNLIPVDIANTIGAIYNVLLIAVPIIVVIFGAIDFVKAVVAGKEDEIKKNTSTFVKRLITGVIVFFVLALVKFVTNLIKTDSTEGVAACLNTIFGNGINND